MIRAYLVDALLITVVVAMVFNLVQLALVLKKLQYFDRKYHHYRARMFEGLYGFMYSIGWLFCFLPLGLWLFLVLVEHGILFGFVSSMTVLSAAGTTYFLWNLRWNLRIHEQIAEGSR